MQKKISMIVCTFNEVNHIERTLKLIDDNLKDCETIIIDDNSQDGTLNKLEKLKSKYKFKLFVRTKERGLASAQVKGFKESTGKYVGTVDANSTDQILYFNKLASKLDDGFDIAVLSSTLKEVETKEYLLDHLQVNLLMLSAKYFLEFHIAILQAAYF